MRARFGPAMAAYRWRRISGSEAEVDRLMTHAANIGATILKPAQRAFWGGYHGYFADPDGHVWEIAHNPFFNLDEAGSVILP